MSAEEKALLYSQDIQPIEDQNDERINISKAVTEDIDIIDNSILWQRWMLKITS